MHDFTRYRSGMRRGGCVASLQDTGRRRCCSATGDGDLTVARAPSANIIHNSPGHVDQATVGTPMTLVHANDHSWHDQNLGTWD
jgi:hypothetical protein